MIGWLIIFSFLVLSYFYSFWFLIAVFPFILWKVHVWYYHNGRPWRKVHFPMMRAYAAASGTESSLAQSEGREFDIKLAIELMLKIINPKLTTTHDQLIDMEFSRYNDFYDKSLISDYLVSKKFEIDKIQKYLNQFQAALSGNRVNSALIVRMVVAAVIEQQFSVEHRGEYMYEVLRGRAI